MVGFFHCNMLIFEEGWFSSSKNWDKMRVWEYYGWLGVRLSGVPRISLEKGKIHRLKSAGILVGGYELVLRVYLTIHE